MAVRDYTDSDGVSWQVWEVIPQSVERRKLRERRIAPRDEHQRRKRHEVRLRPAEGTRMKQYLDLVRTILDTGSWQENRTGIRTISMPGAMLRFDLQQGFPAVTTKKLAFKSAIGELIGFLRASRSAADFRALGCKVWDGNANENAQWLANPYRQGLDDLGDVYGVQWRKWPAYKVLDATARDKKCAVPPDQRRRWDDRLLAAVWLLLDYPWGLLAFVAIAVLYGLL